MSWYQQSQHVGHGPVTQVAVRRGVSGRVVPALWLILGGLWPAQAVAQATEWTSLSSRVIGQVVDPDRRSRPVAGVAVRIHRPDSTVLNVASDRDGRFDLPPLPPGLYRIEGEHIGYHTVADTLRIDGSGRTHFVELQISARAIRLEPLVVTVAPRPAAGALQPVYDRIDAVRIWGGGTVFDRQDIERRNPSRVTFLLDQARGVRVENVRLGVGQAVPLLVSARASARWGPCIMTVYVDDILVVPGGATADLAAADINSLVRVSEIEALEVYHPGGRIPQQYAGTGAGCGVVLIWTRR